MIYFRIKALDAVYTVDWSLPCWEIYLLLGNLLCICILVPLHYPVRAIRVGYTPWKDFNPLSILSQPVLKPVAAVVTHFVASEMVTVHAVAVLPNLLFLDTSSFNHLYLWWAVAVMVLGGTNV